MGPGRHTGRLDGSFLWRLGRVALQDGDSSTQRVPTSFGVLPTGHVCTMVDRTGSLEHARGGHPSRIRNRNGPSVALATIHPRTTDIQSVVCTEFAPYDRLPVCRPTEYDAPSSYLIAPSSQKSQGSLKRAVSVWEKHGLTAEDKGFEPSTGFPAPDFESGS